MAKKAKKAKNIPGVTCLSLGRALSHAECGLAYAANALIDGKASGVSMGALTVFDTMGQVHRLIGSGNKLVDGIVHKSNFIWREIGVKKKISASKSKQWLEDIRKMKSDIDLLFAAGASICSGKK